MNDILSVASSTTTTIDVIGYIAIPLAIAFVAASWALIKGILRFVQFMARSEAAQRSIADSNVEIRDKLVETRDQLAEFAEKTNDRLNKHDRDIAVLQDRDNFYQENSNGVDPLPKRAKRTRRPIGNIGEAENA